MNGLLNMRTLTLPKRGWQNIIIRLAMCQASGTGHRQIDSTYGGDYSTGGVWECQRQRVPVSSTGQAPVSSTGQAPVSSTGQAPVSSTGQAPVSSTGQAPVSSTGQAPVSSTGQAPVSEHGTCLRQAEDGRGGQGRGGCWLLVGKGWEGRGRVVGGEGREGRGRDGEVFGWEGWGGSQASGVEGLWRVRGVEGEGCPG